MYNVALFAHLLGALLLVSGVALAGAGFETARSREDPREVSLLLGLARLGVPLVAIGSLLLGAFGLWLVHLAGWGYGSGWVVWAIALFALALALGAFGGQQPKRARMHASRLAEQGLPADATLRCLLADRRCRAANYASVALIVATLALMVFK